MNWYRCLQLSLLYIKMACFSMLPVVLVYYFFNANVCVYLIVLSKLLVRLDDLVKLGFAVLYIFAYYVVISFSRWANFNVRT